VTPALTADGGALEKVVVALLGRIARGASVVIRGLTAVKSFSCWKKAVAEFEGKVSLGVVTAESGRKVVPIYGVNSRLGPLAPNAVFEESVVSKGAADGAQEVAGNGLACQVISIPRAPLLVKSR
jgi:hypothetical protein